MQGQGRHLRRSFGLGVRRQRFSSAALMAGTLPTPPHIWASVSQCVIERRQLISMVSKGSPSLGS